ncbi:MAG: sodium-dependent bicarbonate transport family permease [Verrucomicrobia bacterium]|nr:sodium-dependent bicarbonate transport family permease [Verrucomicrobiota bacterium]
MDLTLLYENMTNPALLFFLLGIVAVSLKSDLEIPKTSSNFISLYLLFSIGFRGGQELAHSHISAEVIATVVAGVVSALAIPILSFFILKKKLGGQNAGAIAAAYGSVSAVTFVTTVSYLEVQSMTFGGHMIAVMAMMEAPSIIMGLLLVSIFCRDEEVQFSIGKITKHALASGSVLLILGSLIIGFIATDKQAEGIRPFTTELFKGFLAIFLLDMGITSGKKLNGFWKNGWTPLLFSIFTPIINGSIMAAVSTYFVSSEGDRLLLSILAAGASYIAVPAAMRISLPKANPGLYIPMALAITFPVNITIGIPIYHYIINAIH